MKPTQEQILQWAREAGFEDYEWTSLSGHSDLDETLQVGEYPIGESVFLLATLAYEAGRKDENEACEKLHEEMWAASVSADSTVEAFNGALKNYARVIRARRGQ